MAPRLVSQIVLYPHGPRTAHDGKQACASDRASTHTAVEGETDLRWGGASIEGSVQSALVEVGSYADDAAWIAPSGPEALGRGPARAGCNGRMLIEQ